MDKHNPNKRPTPRMDERETKVKERPGREQYRGEFSGVERERCGGGYRVTRRGPDYHGH